MRAGFSVLGRFRSYGEAKAVESRLQYRLEVDGISADPGNGDDEIEHLLERQVAADLLCVLSCDKERTPGFEHPGPAFPEDGAGGVSMREQLRGDESFAGGKRENLVEPRDEIAPGVSPRNVTAASQTTSTSSL